MLAISYEMNKCAKFYDFVIALSTKTSLIIQRIFLQTMRFVHRKFFNLIIFSPCFRVRTHVFGVL